MAKAQLETKLARIVREIKKSFFQYINGKKQIRNNTGPFQDEDGLLTNRGMDMAECLMFLCLSSAQMMDQRGLSALSWRTVTLKMSNFQLTPKQQDLLLHMDACKSMGPHGTHVRILKMLLMSLQNLSMIFEQFWESRGVPADWKLANIPVFNIKEEDPGNHRPVSPTSVPGQIMEEMIWEVLRNTWRTVQASVTASTAPGRKVLLVESDLLL